MKPHDSYFKLAAFASAQSNHEQKAANRTFNVHGYAVVYC